MMLASNIIQLMAHKKYDEALDLACQAILQSPEKSEYYHVKACCDYFLERYSDGLNAIEQAVKLSPESKESMEFDWSLLLMKSERYSEALVHFDNVLLREPTHVIAHVYKGQCLQNQQEYKPAEAEFKLALQLDDSCITAHHQLGVCFFKQGLYADSLTHLKQALRLDTENADIRYDLAHTHLKLGEKKSAMIEVQMIRHLNENLANQLSNEISQVAKEAAANPAGYSPI